ncbi:MAG: conjugal transfer protein TraS, partial [Burkholderiales bacterium]|nr:conjugal transfer protein TraS [Burkholderiales bacterium]
MIPGPVVDGVLVQWGERLFYPPNRVVRPSTTPRLDTMTRRKAAVIHHRIAATVARRAPQVMVKVTGGGRGMAAIAAHFRYISKNGQLVVEDDRGARSQGKEALHDLVEQWRHGGSLIEETSERREAFNIMLSMPHGTDARAVMKAAAEFARIELHGHRYVMVLHEHQANPHVHLSVRAESRSGP